MLRVVCMLCVSAVCCVLCVLCVSAVCCVLCVACMRPRVGHVPELGTRLARAGSDRAL